MEELLLQVYRHAPAPDGGVILLQLALCVVGIVSTIWVAFDAQNLLAKVPEDERKANGLWSPAAWAVGCFFLWIIFFPLYLLRRGDYKKWSAE